jgi:hypothetical protein
MNHIINLLYIFAWGIVSVISSFSKVLENGFVYFENAIFKDEFLSPLVIWLIAFLVDIAFSAATLDRKKQQFSKVCISLTFITMIFELALIIACLYLNGKLFNYIGVAWFLIGMLSLKAESLYIIENVNELEEI